MTDCAEITFNIEQNVDLLNSTIDQHYDILTRILKY